MKRVFKIGTGLLAISLALVACQAGQQDPGPQQPAAPLPLIACTSSTSANQIVFVYAQEQGLFEQYGLQVELVTFNSGSDAAIALITGAVDICQVAGPSVVNAAAAGEDLVFIGGLFNRHLYSIITRPEIQSPADLVGTSFAISKPGSSTDALMRIAIQHWGLQVDRDITLLSVGNQSERLAALESGQVAGTVLSVPETAQAKALGYQIFLDLGDLELAYPSLAIATRRVYLQENQEAAQRFIQAITAAIQEMKQARATTLAVLADYLMLDPVTDADLLTEAYQVLVLQRLEYPPLVNEASIQAVIDLAVMENPAAADLQSADLIDNSLVLAAQEILTAGDE